jgi:hypothetical protein
METEAKRRMKLGLVFVHMDVLMTQSVRRRGKLLRSTRWFFPQPALLASQVWGRSWRVVLNASVGWKNPFKRFVEAGCPITKTAQNQSVEVEREDRTDSFWAAASFADQDNDPLFSNCNMQLIVQKFCKFGGGPFSCHVLVGRICDAVCHYHNC